MNTEIEWLHPDHLRLDELATPMPEPPVPDDFICGEELLSLARLEFTSMVELFGDARDILLKRFLPLCEWLDLECWLAHLERLVRGGLLMLALRIAAPRVEAQLSAPSPSRAPQVSGEARPPSRTCGFAVMLPCSDGRCSESRKGSSVPALRRTAGLKPTRSLALRIDALLRALNDPAPFARRLARKLERVMRPHRVPKPRAPRDPFDKTRRGAASNVAIATLRRAWPGLRLTFARYFAPS